MINISCGKKFERITTSEHPFYKDAMDLYKISFPLHEQREAVSQAEILKNPAYHFVVVCDEDEFVGEILYWDIGDFLLYRTFLCSSCHEKSAVWSENSR